MDSNGLYCGNLSSRVTEELLFELFLQAGPIENVVLPKDAAGETRAYGFVFFKHGCSVDYAISLFRGTCLFDRELDLRPRTRGQNGDPSGSAARSSYSASSQRVQYGHVTQPCLPVPPAQQLISYRQFHSQVSLFPQETKTGAFSLDTRSFSGRDLDSRHGDRRRDDVDRVRERDFEPSSRYDRRNQPACDERRSEAGSQYHRQRSHTYHR